jgi:hypothetical protein
VLLGRIEASNAEVIVGVGGGDGFRSGLVFGVEADAPKTVFFWCVPGGEAIDVLTALHPFHV